MVQHSVNKFRQKQFSVFQRHIIFRRYQIYRIRLDGHLIFRLFHLHLCVLSQDIRHKALIIRGQMLHHNKAEPAVAGHMLEKLLQRFQASGGSSYPDYKGSLWSFFVFLFCHPMFLLLNFFFLYQILFFEFSWRQGPGVIKSLPVAAARL